MNAPVLRQTGRSLTSTHTLSTFETPNIATAQETWRFAENDECA